MATAQKRASAPTSKADDQLARYRSMRDFKTTAEPRGNGSGKAREKAAGLHFVVQKHAARQLHYDFRLEWNGVLKSWAVAKGPSYFPGNKRLAVHVEDHPLEYGRFEGTIPKGQYGGGAVMVWDIGTWAPLGDAERGLREGHLKFELKGKKLKGSWALVRMHGRADRSGRENWLLIKERDEFAREESDPAVIEEAPDSVLTGRDIDQIAVGKGKVWNSSRAKAEKNGNGTEPNSGGAASADSAAGERRLRNLRSTVKSLPRESFPGFISPQLAQSAATPPKGEGWVHEIKLDGYRIQIQIRAIASQSRSRRDAILYTRKGLDWTARMPDIARAAAQLHVESAIIDGEAVALNDEGVSDFAALQAAFQEETRRDITYFAFDLLHLDGHNLRNLSLVERKELLANLIKASGDHGPIRYSEHLQADGKEVFAKACALGAEGIVAKVASSKYVSGRSNAWLKLKCIQQQELVIGGFTPPSKGGVGVGALLLGYYDGGKLRYAGRSGTGFTQRTHRMLRQRLDALTQKECPFAEIPREARRDANWVKPQLVAQIAFTTWTRDNLVRQAAFKGLREDKPAKEVVREVAIAAEPGNEKKAKMRSTPTVPSAQKKRSGSTRASDELPITHPDKILDAESGLTKRQLAEYYAAVAEHMLPHVGGRPLSVVRCPEGSDKPCFFQKHVGMGTPKGVSSVSVKSRKSGKVDDYLSVDSADGLVGLAQMGVLEIHPWGSKNESLDKPDRIIIDLDPDTAIDWKTLAHAAGEVRKRLKQLRLESFLKSTGGKGLHVVVPIIPEQEWPVVKDFAHELVLAMEQQEPELYVTKMTKASRKNRIYLDYLRNDRDATAIAPFSPRARHRAPVAMPLRWSELDAKELPRFYLSGFGEWRSRLRQDPWKAMATVKQRLPLDVFPATSSGRSGGRRAVK
ncbi:MAG TPA: DNA ligase D [Terracidiphilus sp.]|nr:DNA ligase D [Terracidiphilus sp.]